LIFKPDRFSKPINNHLRTWILASEAAKNNKVSSEKYKFKIYKSFVDKYTPCSKPAVEAFERIICNVSDIISNRKGDKGSLYLTPLL
jgi:predicted secreted protein